MRTGSFRLFVLGLVGVTFFIATDARLGWGARLDGVGHTNVIDAIHTAWPGTLVGLAGSGLVAIIGLCLTIRRRA